jgi:transglutaminase-like putative cysteine protease
MRLTRRTFLQASGAAAALTFGLPRRGQAAPEEVWRNFEVLHRVEVLAPRGLTRVWLPLPLLERTDYQRLQSNAIHAPGGQANVVKDAAAGLAFVAAEWEAGARPVLEVVSRVSTRDRAVDVSGARRKTARLDPATHARCTAPTRLIPTDGIVLETARKITAGVGDDAVARARAVYQWICEHTVRDAKVAGCGVGDIKATLEHDVVGGKCADLNGLFVGLMRALGVPARDVYGVRVAPSRRGYSALGAKSDGTITKAQHCRAEFFVDGLGWVPVDPADVRKLILEEPPGNLTLDDAKVAGARAQLFGGWEMNWIAYNRAADVSLPRSNRASLPFLMYPQAETAEGTLDPLDAAAFRYEIHAREL